MNINTLLGSSTSSSQATVAASAASPGLGRALQRLQSDADATSAQLSKLGLLKSALADGQTSAKALSGLGAASSASDVTAALGTFFKTFNATVNAATAASGSGSALASSNARRVVQDLKAALRADPATTAALKKLGLSVQSNGTLSQDAHVFANALAADAGGVRAALAAVGKKVDAISAQELAGNGTVGTALASLNQHNSTLTAQQSAMKNLQQAMAAYQSSASA